MSDKLDDGTQIEMDRDVEMCEICNNEFEKMKTVWKQDEPPQPVETYGLSYRATQVVTKKEGWFTSTDIVKSIGICGLCTKIVTKDIRNPFNATLNTKEDWDIVKEIKAQEFTFDYIYNNIDAVRELGKKYYEKLEKHRETQYREDLKYKAERKKSERESKASAKRESTKRISKLRASIKKLLKQKAVKMPASDIDAHLKHKNVDEIKKLCEEMYQKGQISRTGNYRYFILTEKKKIPKPKKSAAKKSDPTAEIRKYAKLRDDGLITEEEYQAKKKELLGL
tara:strand:+ start:960 stop:1802 length:843 start_codon:yes stop_codon:yes gene_type:complete